MFLLYFIELMSLIWVNETRLCLTDLVKKGNLAVKPSNARTPKACTHPSHISVATPDCDSTLLANVILKPIKH